MKILFKCNVNISSSYLRYIIEQVEGAITKRNKSINFLLFESMLTHAVTKKKMKKIPYNDRR